MVKLTMAVGRVAAAFKLHSGALMPTIALGTFDNSSVETAVDCALQVGYRHIDTARSYKNEKSIGDVLKSRLGNGLKRRDLFVTTKVPSVALGCEKDIVSSVLSSLEALKLSYVDMCLVHSPFYFTEEVDGSRKDQPVDLVEVWKSMEKCLKDGYTKAIGVSNFNRFQLHRIWERSLVKPSNVQLECHAYYQQAGLREFCNGRGIAVTAYAPLGAPGRPPRHQYHGDVELLKDPAVLKLAKENNRTESQLLLRFLLQLGFIPLPKSSNPARIEENFQLFDFSLDDASMESLKKLDCGQKYFKFLNCKNNQEFLEGEPF